MSFVRNTFAMTGFVVLSACAQAVTNPAETSGGLFVSDVNVSVAPSIANQSSVVTGRSYQVGSAKLVSDLEASLRSSLAQNSDATGTPVRVSVVVNEVFLAPPAGRVVAATSFIKGSLSVTKADGEAVIPPRAIRGTTDNIRLAGALGLVTTQSGEEDYRGTLRGFAKTVRTALFGKSDGA